MPLIRIEGPGYPSPGTFNGIILRSSTNTETPLSHPQPLDRTRYGSGTKQEERAGPNRYANREGANCWLPGTDRVLTRNCQHECTSETVVPRSSELHLAWIEGCDPMNIEYVATNVN